MAPAVKDDAVLAAAVDLAREAADSIAEPGTVGDHLGHGDGRRAPRHPLLRLHRQRLPGLALGDHRRPRAARARPRRCARPTSCRATARCCRRQWLPYADRLAPGDLGAGDVLPYKEDDPLLEPGFEATGDEEVDELAVYELGLGPQARAVGRGARGGRPALVRGRARPALPGVAEKAPAPCSSCGFFLPMAGALAGFFRRVRQRLVTLRRSRREPGPRLRRPLRGRRRGR